MLCQTQKVLSQAEYTRAYCRMIYAYIPPEKRDPKIKLKFRWRHIRHIKLVPSPISNPLDGLSSDSLSAPED